MLANCIILVVDINSYLSQYVLSVYLQVSGRDYGSQSFLMVGFVSLTLAATLAFSPHVTYSFVLAGDDEE